jgi:hypothetical protein
VDSRTENDDERESRAPTLVRDPGGSIRSS